MLKLKLAVEAPVAVGVNTTLMAHLAPTATEEPQAEVSEYCAAFVPESPMLVIGSVNVPVLVTVTVCAALDVFTCTLPKPIEVGDTV